MKYDIKFDKKNTDCICIFKDDKNVTYIACPPIEKGCDIINFSDKLNDGYTHDFDGLILITTKNHRKLYYKGDLIAETYRKNQNFNLLLQLSETSYSEPD